jgi:hypothetical protein
MHQPTDPLNKEFPGLLLEPLHYHSLDVFIQPNILPFSAFLRGPNTWNSHMTGLGCIGGSQHLLANGVQHVLDSTGHMETAIAAQHNQTPCEHARTLSPDGGMRV